jgi:hypothetical protein
LKTNPFRATVTAILAIATLISFSDRTWAFFAKEVFTRSKPHISAGFVSGQAADLWIHAEAGLFDDGKATGVLQFREIGGESFLYRVIEGEAILDGEEPVGMIFTVVRVGEGGSPTGETDMVIVRQSEADEDCLIYTTVGTDIWVEAVGRIGLRHEHVRPESR